MLPQVVQQLLVKLLRLLIIKEQFILEQLLILKPQPGVAVMELAL